MHPVERGRLGRANVCAHVLDRVVAECQQLAVLGERRLEARPPLGRLRSGGEVLEPVFGPADGDAEVARREPEQDDVGVDGGLDAEASARLGRGDQAQSRSRQAEGARRHRVQRERTLEVRPGRERACRSVPVGDDTAGLDGIARPTRRPEPLGDDQGRAGKGALDVAVAEGAIRDHLAGVRVGDGVERLQIELDQLERVLRDVAVTCDDNCEWLAGVTRDFVGRGQVGRCIGDADCERMRETSHVGAREHADHPRERECSRGVERVHARVGER